MKVMLMENLLLKKKYFYEAFPSFTGRLDEQVAHHFI
jgi:hypothetical protein